MNNIKSLSIAAPAYNEAENIAHIVEKWQEYLSHQDLESFEIVVCNDGSRDDTGKILDELACKYDSIRSVHHRSNQGAAAALSSAINHTKGDWVLLLDCDGQFPVQNLENFNQALNNQSAKSYIGVRPGKSDSLFARFGSWISGVLCNVIYGTKYKDFNSACKLVDGKVLRWLTLEAKGLNYSTDITAKLIASGFPPVEVSIQHEIRKGGRSSRTLLRSSFHRFLFVSYLLDRQILTKLNVIKSPLDDERRPYA